MLPRKCHDFAPRPGSSVVAALVEKNHENMELILFDWKTLQSRVLATFDPDHPALHLDWNKDGTILYYDRIGKGADLYSIAKR
jgi:hypothetical protein